MPCNTAHPRVRVRVRVRVRMKVRVKSRPIGLTSSRSSCYTYIRPINSLVTLHYGIRVQNGVRVRVRVRVTVRAISQLGLVLRVHRG